MKAFIDKEKCMFCGLCGGISSDIFRTDTDGKSVSLDVRLTDDLLKDANYAQSICPTYAISLIDDSCH